MLLSPQLLEKISEYYTGSEKAHTYQQIKYIHKTSLMVLRYDLLCSESVKIGLIKCINRVIPL
ncbi:MAG: hypothetical protein EB060_07395 [Proteobacteria bacterium]|nr:hypothetical protein [Pseudomonadota bacterium]